MINKILMGIFKLIISLVELILSPIDALIETLLPDVSTALTSFGNFMSLAFSYIGWGISLLGIPQIAINIIIMYYGVKLVAPLLFYMIKLALKWYNRLKP